MTEFILLALIAVALLAWLAYTEKQYNEENDEENYNDPPHVKSTIYCDGESHCIDI